VLSVLLRFRDSSCIFDIFKLFRIATECIFHKNQWHVPFTVMTIQYIPTFLLKIEFLVTRLTRRVPLVEQELHTHPEHMSSPPVFSSIFSFICMLCRSLFLLLCIFLLAIVLSFLHRYTISDYPFRIFKLFLQTQSKRHACGPGFQVPYVLVYLCSIA
jgi:hypothetical protein